MRSDIGNQIQSDIVQENGVETRQEITFGQLLGKGRAEHLVSGNTKPSSADSLDEYQIPRSLFERKNG